MHYEQNALKFSLPQEESGATKALAVSQAMIPQLSRYLALYTAPPRLLHVAEYSCAMLEHPPTNSFPESKKASTFTGGLLQDWRPPMLSWLFYTAVSAARTLRPSIASHRNMCVILLVASAHNWWRSAFLDSARPSL